MKGRRPKKTKGKRMRSWKIRALYSGSGAKFWGAAGAGHRGGREGQKGWPPSRAREANFQDKKEDNPKKVDFD